MNAVGQTIAGAASGEIASNAAPKGSQSQAKGQKSNNNYFLCVYCYSCFLRLEKIQPLFLLFFPDCSIYHKGYSR
jgi:hypothetical protein